MSWLGVARLLGRLRSLGRWQGAPLAVVLIIALAAVRALNPAPVDSLKLRWFDLLQELKPREYVAAPVAIVDIDEESLARLGQWPWPRDLMARLVDGIAASGAPVIGFDVLFAEPDRYSPERLADNLPALDEETRARLRALPRNDDLLAESFRRTKVVLGIGALRQAEGGVPLPAHYAVSPVREKGGDPRPALPAFDTTLHSVDVLSRNAASLASLTVVKERDGIVRRVPLAVTIGSVIVPALSIEMIRQALGAPWLNLVRDERGVSAIGVGPAMIPTEPDGRLWIHYTPHRPERFVTAADIVEGRLPPGRLKGHLVLVGSSSLGLGDFQATPVEARMPGVEVHAQVVEAILTGATLSRPGWLGYVEVALIAVFGALATALVPAIRPALSPLAYVGLVVLLIAGAWLAYDRFGVLFDPTAIAVASGIIYTVMLMTARIAAERERRRLALALEEQRRAAARIEGELSAARSIQLGILPRRFPAFPERRDFDVHAMLEPASAVGGDLYDFALIDDDHLFFVIGDVSGKGVQAALFMAITKALYKSNILRGHYGIDRVMQDANAEISRENTADFFVTLLAGIIDLRSGALEFCIAGHDAPILHRPGAPVRHLEGEGGPPLCIVEDYPYPVESYRLERGDTLVLVTDGVTEAHDGAQRLYGMAGIEALLARLPPDATPKLVVEALYADINAFAAGTPQSDDIAILAIRYEGVG
ncbi:MAG: CHASE2 domain-containing protein [Alphaproteobacteria bacterium]